MFSFDTVHILLQYLVFVNLFSEVDVKFLSGLAIAAGPDTPDQGK